MIDGYLLYLTQELELCINDCWSKHLKFDFLFQQKRDRKRQRYVRQMDAKLLHKMT